VVQNRVTVWYSTTAVTAPNFQDAGGKRKCGSLVLDDVQFAWFEEKLKGEAGAVDAALSKVFPDREGHRALESRRRQDVAGVAGIGQPSHDRAEALRHAGGRIADAMIVREKKPHDSERIDRSCVSSTD